MGWQELVELTVGRGVGREPVSWGSEWIGAPTPAPGVPRRHRAAMPPSTRLVTAHAQPFLLVETVHPLLVYPPALATERHPDPRVSKHLTVGGVPSA